MKRITPNGPQHFALRRLLPLHLTVVGALRADSWLYRCGCLLAAALFFVTASHAVAAMSPNFIVLIADDLGFDDLGCYGRWDARTPNIDSLARNGLRFEHAYLTASSCSPSRSSIITGRYPHNLGEAAELHRPIAGHLPSIAGLLREEGYYTALAGKNHMRWSVPEEGLKAPTPPFEKVYGGKTSANSGGHGNWINALSECPEGRPFFLWLASFDPHRTWDGDLEWDAGRYGEKHDPARVILPPALIDTPATRSDFASYLNEVTRFDYFVGEVVAWLKESGKLHTTWIFLLSDNGRPFPRAKTRLIDDGMKTPLIIIGPKIDHQGAGCASLVSAIDLAPTIAELAGVEGSPTFQGRSLVPALKDPSVAIRPYAFSEQNWHDYEALGRSVRDGRFLYIRDFRPGLAQQGPADSVASPSFQAMRAARSSGTALLPIQLDVFVKTRHEAELYDTHADPFQISNLAGRPEMAGIERRLAAALARWMEETCDSVPGEVTPDMFDRETGLPLPIDKAKTYRPPPGAHRRASWCNSDGL